MKQWTWAAAVCLACLAPAAPALGADELTSLRMAAQLASAPKFIQHAEAGARHVTGLCVDINRAIERQDPSLRIRGDQHSLPLTRIEAQLRSGELDLACGLLRTREREAAFTYLEPALFAVTYFMVVRADDNIEINNWDDVRSLAGDRTILLIHGQGTASRLRELGGLHIDAGATDARSNLHKLLAGRGRFYYHRMPGLTTEIRLAALEDKVRVLPAVMDMQRFHLMAGRHVAPATLDKLRRALAQLEGSGELKRLFERWYAEAETSAAPSAQRGAASTWVQYTRPGRSPGAMPNAAPTSVNLGFMMFAQWPGLSSQPATAASAVSWPAAMFSPTRRQR